MHCANVTEAGTLKLRAVVCAESTIDLSHASCTLVATSYFSGIPRRKVETTYSPTRDFYVGSPQSPLSGSGASTGS